MGTIMRLKQLMGIGLPPNLVGTRFIASAIYRLAGHINAGTDSMNRGRDKSGPYLLACAGNVY